MLEGQLREPGRSWAVAVDSVSLSRPSLTIGKDCAVEPSHCVLNEVLRSIEKIFCSGILVVDLVELEVLLSKLVITESNHVAVDPAGALAANRFTFLTLTERPLPEVHFYCVLFSLI